MEHPPLLDLRGQGSRTDEQGEVRRDVKVPDQDDVVVALYELLTMVGSQPRWWVRACRRRRAAAPCP